MNRYEYYSNLKEFKDNKEEENTLKHYGIIGQKWGQRRWQNADGTFNDEGKVRYFGSKKKNSSESDDKNSIFDEKKYLEDVRKKTKMSKKDFYEFEETTKDISERMTENAKKNKGDEFRKENEKLEQELLNSSIVKKHFEEMQKIYNETGNWDEAEKYYWKQPELAEQDTWILDVMENNLPSNQNDQKFGVVAEYPIAIVSSIKNYKNGEQLIQDIDKVISTGDEKYSKEELSSIMSNKKKLATMMDAADKGDDETYNKMAKKIKDKDKEAIEKFMKDANNQIIKTPVDENIQKDIEKIGGFTKPKINKKYLNEDGTLNEEGLRRTENNRKTSRVFASIFKGLRNANTYGATVGTGILFAIMAATGVGMPAAISMALAGAATSGITAGVDHALYKKLEERADNYYIELKTRV